ncbi:MAG: hypothetical protein AB7O31_13425 [Burkholderiales bacterium]
MKPKRTPARSKGRQRSIPRSADHIALRGAKPGQRVLRFLFTDGSTADVNPVEWELRIAQQKETADRYNEIAQATIAHVELERRTAIREQGRDGGKQSAERKRQRATAWQKSIAPRVADLIGKGKTDANIGALLAKDAGRSPDTVRRLSAKIRHSK